MVRSSSDFVDRAYRLELLYSKSRFHTCCSKDDLIIWALHSMLAAREFDAYSLSKLEIMMTMRRAEPAALPYLLTASRGLQTQHYYLRKHPCSTLQYLDIELCMI